jgi:hypothetical protein
MDGPEVAAFKAANRRRRPKAISRAAAQSAEIGRHRNSSFEVCNADNQTFVRGDCRRQISRPQLPAS